ncbi:MAG: NADH:ubiquinone reductase (Na(+)-transporting) subunit B [Bacteroidales bacterium]|nr:NADH:ubiquinone reductase (Na(+)-transporting) subunit B [Bacteroidales bacterium]MBQ2574027.1 NADH:ubiquinone reductase (Na(+)-transporting) subunit B [Bacteroidales bacterium]
MNPIRKIIDNIKPKVLGKMPFMTSTFEAFETFFFVPKDVTENGSHIRDAIDMKRTMIIVVFALIPCLLFGMYNVGYQHFNSMGVLAETGFWTVFWYGFLKVFWLLLVSYLVGLTIEFAFAQVRKHKVNEGFLVTGMLIPLIMPVDTPLWMVALATAFAVLVGKELFGGTGMNIVNPALLARAFLFFSYPSKMSGDKIWIAGMTDGNAVDGFSGATPLAQIGEGSDVITNGFGEPTSILDLTIGLIPGSIGETSIIAIALGAFILLFTGIASWKIMFSVFAGGAAMAFALQSYTPIDWYWHLCLGGFAFGAVFMATDPVTAAQTEKGKYIYGFLIGVMAMLIRILNPAYPEGMMLAILLMNIFAPLIDYCVVRANINKRLRRVKVRRVRRRKNR